MSYLNNLNLYQQNMLVELFQKLIDEGVIVLELSEGAPKGGGPKGGPKTPNVMKDLGLGVDPRPRLFLRRSMPFEIKPPSSL